MIRLKARLLYVLVVALMFFCHSVIAQVNDNKAKAKVELAIQLEAQKDFKGALKLLHEADSIDPANNNYKYETAYAYYLDGEYRTAYKILAKIVRKKDATFLTYQLTGNCLYQLNKTDSAKQVYEKGVKRFPNAGALYHELGALEGELNKYNDAAAYYEQGIKMDPTYAPNYYNAANLYLHSSQRVWGMLYGELFINLERNTPRTEQMSASLYNTYREQIGFMRDTGVTVDFSRLDIVPANTQAKKKGIQTQRSQSPYGRAVYEAIIKASALGEHTIDLESLNRIRTRFIKTYYAKKYDAIYPNVLFEYQHKLEQLGYLDAYNHWLLMKGDDDAFAAWLKTNKDKWNAFAKWFHDNPIQLDNKHYFISTQYN